MSDSIYLALCAVFGLNPQSEDSLKRFVPAYIENATNTQAPRDANVCYYAISEVQDSDFDYIQIGNAAKNASHTQTLTVTVPIDVLFTFYGENADNDAEHFWQNIQFDPGSGSARAILRGKKIVPMGKPSRPRSVYEVEGTFQRRRCDVQMAFAYLMETNSTNGYVDKAPVLRVINN